MNLNLYGHNGAWLMVDCGVAFDDNVTVMPDTRFIEAHRAQLAGIIITHAHQDHIGALADLWPVLRAPVYTTPFTARILQQKLMERGLTDVPAVTADCDARLQIGPFDVRWLPITHSTPETHALLISTPPGNLLHTSDWKIDPDPVTGQPFESHYFSGHDILAMVCDSTNANRPGRSVSEGALLPGLRDCISAATGRVIVTCFASNVARLQTLSTIAAETNRHIGLMGRSMNQMWEAGQACDYLDPGVQRHDVADLGYLPPGEVMLIVSGSQGEAGAALGRLAADGHPDINLDPGDLVIFSARTIPGNEGKIASLISTFEQRGIHVIHAESSNRLLHASGHPHQDELRDMYRWVKPDIAIPVHGETEHMAANATVARDAGVPHQLLGKNGDLFVIAGVDSPTVHPSQVPAGRVTTG